MPNALQITDPNADNPLAQAPSWADAAQSVAGTVSGGVDALGQWLAAQRAKGNRRGPVWPMSNPVGTETTQSMQTATPIDQIAFMRPDGTPVMQSDMAAAHHQVQQAMQTAPTMVLGMMGTTAPGKVPPIEVSSGYVKGQSNIVRFREDADAIQSALPPVPEGHTRLWRGNRPDEIGTNQQFTSDLPGIALPFREAYGGPVSYVDVPSSAVDSHLQKDFAAPGVEYWLPPDIAKQAKAVHVAPRSEPGARKTQ